MLLELSCFSMIEEGKKKSFKKKKKKSPWCSAVFTANKFFSTDWTK